MSFSQTTPQVLAREKTVTRRIGWRFLQPGDLVQAVDKARTLAVLRIVDVRVEPLSRLVTDPRYGEDELPREGFPCWQRDEFIETFLRTHGLKSIDDEVTRIEFQYVQ